MELELPKDVKDRLRELQTLSEKAENGDKSARQELRKALRESAPEVISQAQTSVGGASVGTGGDHCGW